MTAKGKQKIRQEGIRIFLKGAEVSLRKIEEKFLLLAKCLREKRDIRTDDLDEISDQLRALNAMASKAGLQKTVDLTRHWGMLLEYAREHALTLDMLRKVTQSDLLDSDVALQQSIRLRNPFIDPINYIQVNLIRTLRTKKLSPAERERLIHVILLTVNCIATGMRNTG